MSSHRFIHIFALILVILSFSFLGCTAAKDDTGNRGSRDQMMVYTTVYPLYDFASKVGGDRIKIKNIVPPGGEPHQWEPAPRDLADIGGADVVIYCGTGMEYWLDKLLPSLNPAKVAVVNAGQNVPTQGADPKQGDPADYCQAAVDPHIWVDPLNAKVMVDNILAGLNQADPANKKFYAANAARFKKELDALHDEYQTSLAGAQGKEFVVSHAAFGYLAQRYGLKQVAVRGLSPEVEPSPGDMAHIVKIAREKEIKVIFTETTVSPKVAEALAGELSAKTLVLNPMDALTKEDLAAGRDYLHIMRENLKNLKLALGVNL